MKDVEKKAKLGIGVDIDGVIADTMELQARAFSNFYGYEISVEDLLWRFQEIVGAQEFVNENMEQLYYSAEPVEFAIEAINSLREKHKICFITARRQPAFLPTLNWFRRHGLDLEPDDLILVGNKSKARVCESMGLNLFIEDSPQYAEEIVAAGIPVILYQREYNLSYRHDLVVHREGWREIIKEIEARTSQK